MNSKIFWQLSEAYQLGVCNQKVVEEETLSEEELVNIEEWVEALIEEGYDLDQFSDEELCEAYLEELYQGRHGQSASQYMAGRSDAGKRISGDEKTGPRYYTLGRSRGATPDAPTQPGARPVNTPKLSSSEKEYSNYQHGATMKGINKGYLKVGGPKGLSEDVDLYDIVSEYLVSEGFCDSYEDADVIMVNMSEEWRESIMEEAAILSITSPEGKKRKVNRRYPSATASQRAQDIRKLGELQRRQKENPRAMGPRSARRQAANEFETNLKNSIVRLNAKSDGDLDSEDYIRQAGGYDSKRTDRAARGRRAKGI
jgi:hypothetical protein